MHPFRIFGGAFHFSIDTAFVTLGAQYWGACEYAQGRCIHKGHNHEKAAEWPVVNFNFGFRFGRVRQ